MEDKQSLHYTILCAVSMEGPDKLRKLISEIIVLQEVGKCLLKMDRIPLHDSSGAKFSRNFIQKVAFLTILVENPTFSYLSVQCQWFVCPPENLPWIDEHCDLDGRERALSLAVTVRSMTWVFHCIVSAVMMQVLT